MIIVATIFGGRSQDNDYADAYPMGITQTRKASDRIEAYSIALGMVAELYEDGNIPNVLHNRHGNEVSHIGADGTFDDEGNENRTGESFVYAELKESGYWSTQIDGKAWTVQVLDVQ
jgi:hypothetical protein